MSSLHQVEQKYKSLKFGSLGDHLSALIEQADSNELSYLQFAESLIDAELSKREEKRIHGNLKRAGFPVVKSLDEFDYRFQTTITKRQVSSLLDFSFIENRENLILIGPPGVGKTHLSIGIGQKAIHAGYKVLFTTVASLIELLEIAELKGELKKKINSYLKHDVLILDELGYLPMNKSGMYNLFQLINGFYEYRSIILTTNKEFMNWGEFFMDDQVAVPVVDRLIHHSQIFMLGGESYRLKEKKSKF